MILTWHSVIACGQILACISSVSEEHDEISLKELF